MTATRIAVVGGLALLGFLCWLAVGGFGAMGEILITLVALAVMVAGGNWLSSRMGLAGRPGRAAATGTTGDSAGEGRYCPGSELAAGTGRHAAAPTAEGLAGRLPTGTGAERSPPEGMGPER